MNEDTTCVCVMYYIDCIKIVVNMEDDNNSTASKSNQFVLRRVKRELVSCGAFLQ